MRGAKYFIVVVGLLLFVAPGLTLLPGPVLGSQGADDILTPGGTGTPGAGAMTPVGTGTPEDRIPGVTRTPGSDDALTPVGTGTPEDRIPGVTRTPGSDDALTPVGTGTPGAGATMTPAVPGTPAVEDRTPIPGGVGVVFKRGWNLVGGPGGTTFQAVTAPLFTLQGAEGYSAIPGSTGIAKGNGYWAFFPDDKTVIMNGPGEDTHTVTLGAGEMKMIGNPSGTMQAKLEAEVIWTFDASSGYNMQQGSVMLPVGKGAFVFSFSGGTATVKVERTEGPEKPG